MSSKVKTQSSKELVALKSNARKIIATMNNKASWSRIITMNKTLTDTLKKIQKLEANTKVVA